MATLEYIKHPNAPQKELIAGREKKQKNVFTRMAEFTVGPLNMLLRAVEERRRIKVWTRSFKFVRGICTGYIVLFDKHFNMALTDVDEVCVDPRQQRRVFQLNQEQTSKKPKKHKKRKKKTLTPHVADSVNKCEDAVKPTDDNESDVYLSSSATAAQCVSLDLNITLDNLFTDTMMSSLREYTDICMDDCTTMIGGIHSLDIIACGVNEHAADHSSESCKSVDPNVCNAVTTSDIATKTTSACAIVTEQNVGSSVDVSVNSVAQADVSNSQVTLSTGCNPSFILNTPTGRIDPVVIDASNERNDISDVGMSTDGVDDRLQHSSSSDATVSRADACSSQTAVTDVSRVDVRIPTIFSGTHANSASHAVTSGAANVEHSDNIVVSKNSEPKAEAAISVPPYVVEHELSLMASSDLASSDDDAVGENLSELEVVDEVNDSASSEESLTALEVRMKQLQEELSRITTSERKSEHKKEQEKWKTKPASQSSFVSKHKSTADKQRYEEHKSKRDSSKSSTSKKESRENEKHRSQKNESRFVVPKKQESGASKDIHSKHTKSQRSSSKESIESSIHTKNKEVKSKEKAQKHSSTKEQCQLLDRAKESKKSKDSDSSFRVVNKSNTQDSKRHLRSHSIEAPLCKDSNNSALVVSKSDKQKNVSHLKTQSTEVPDLTAKLVLNSGERVRSKKQRSKTPETTETKQVSNKEANKEKNDSDNVFMERVRQKISQSKSEAQVRAYRSVGMHSDENRDAANIAEDQTSAEYEANKEHAETFRAIDGQNVSKHGHGGHSRPTDRHGRRNTKDSTFGTRKPLVCNDTMYYTSPRTVVPEDTSHMFSTYTPMCLPQESALGLSSSMLVTRHVKQLFIRGDNVVMVAFADV